MHGFSDNTEIVVVGAPVANGSAIDNNSTIIDMTGYESVTFITTITDSADTGVATLTIEEGDENSDTGMAAITGTVATVTTAGADALNGTALVAEVRKPNGRYVQAVRTSSVANIAYGSVVAILTPYRKPAVQGGTVSASAYVSN